MRYIRLDKGHLTGEAVVNQEKGYLEKPVMMVYAGKFNSMDGDVEIKDEDIDELVANHNSVLSKLKRLAGAGEVPIHHNPPLQVDHSTSAHDTVGRVVGDVHAGEYTNDDGEKKKAMFGTVRVLGKENMEKVQDGRWSHVSIGADLDKHTLRELSITPFPAAANASLLRRQNDLKNNPELSGNPEGERMGMKETKEKAALYEKCRKHLTEVKKMGEEDADKHLEAAKDEELKQMSDEHDEHLKHLAIEDDKKKSDEEKKKSEMAGSRANMVKLAKGFRTAGTKAMLAKRATDIQIRLGKLRADAKISPAEIKKINIDELAAKSDEAVTAVLSSYEARQPVIDTGVVGSTKAMTTAQLTAQLKKSDLGADELLTRLAMPTKRAEALKQLEAMGMTEAQLQTAAKVVKFSADDGDDDDKDHHLSDDEAHDKYKKMMDEGKHDEAKEHLKSYMKTARAKHLTESMPVSDTSPRMSALADELKSMQNDFEELVKLTAPILGVSDEELK